MTNVEEPAAPPAIALVRDFVNTREPQVDAEELTTPDALTAWCVDRGLLPRRARVERSDLDRAIAVREGLRAVLMTHAGHEVDATEIEMLNEVLEEVPVRVEFGETGPRLAAVVESPGSLVLASILDAVRESAEDRTWGRLKVCARDTCRWAFYDASRNQAKRWCSMAGCGNHVKMRRAYARRSGASDA
jgi:predicted RNA-binding Zn ribbon-like protein